MRSKIADDLAMRLDEGGEVPVIVTLAPGGDVAELERSGLSVGRVFESIRAVSGTLTADSARRKGAGVAGSRSCVRWSRLPTGSRGSPGEPRARGSPARRRRARTRTADRGPGLRGCPTSRRAGA